MSVAPAGYHTVTPYLVVPKSADAIAWYQKAFGAEELFRLTMPDGGVCHAEIKVGTSAVMLSDANPEWGTKAPADLGGTTVGFMVYVRDADGAFAAAVAAGATVVMPVADQFYGDRAGTVLDPFGHKWTLGTRVKELTPAETQAALDVWIKAQG
jgi:PhnB protein